MKKILFLVLFSIMSISSKAQSVCDISATTQLTHSADGVYSVPDTPGYSYFWSVTGNISILSGQGTHSVTIHTSATCEQVSGSIYVTVYKDGAAPCCNEISINIAGDCDSGCGAQVTYIQDLNERGDGTVSFHVVTNFNAGSTYHSSVFTVTFENGDVITPEGTINPTHGYPQIIIPVAETNRVTKVCVVVKASYPGVPKPTICFSDSLCKTFSHGVYGTNDNDNNTNIIIGFGKIKNPVKNELVIKLEDVKQAEVLIYDYSGNLKKRAKITDTQSVDVSDLKNGLYIVKLTSQDGLVDTKKIQIQR